jgi:fructosamine-3-kinase
VFDPAVYIGDREVDLAMSQLFGGFGAVFRAGYESVSRVESGYARRRDAYNLYHLLNHLNLFGGSYLARTARTLARLVA